MIERSVSIYDRGADGLYLHASAYTDTGGLLAVPPFEHVKVDEAPTLLWKKIVGLLAQPRGRVPHPKQWNQLDPMYEMAKCKNWSQFVRNATYCSVAVEEGKYVFIPAVRDGKGFSGLKSQKKVITIGADDAVCQEALFEVLSTSRAAS